ncbi:hypothetical protein [Bacterioplanoides sp.]|uniref:hypothetical protein n=1 Tax=Bacterioplanoides sp. TaxID=2066072 RepID=UPI003B00BEF0
MRKLFKCFIGTLLLIISSYSIANEGWNGPYAIDRIVVTAQGWVNVRFIDSTLSGCKPQSGYPGNYATLSKEHKGFQALNALLLSAYVSGKPVQVWLSDDTCTIGEAVIGGSYSAR